MIRAVALIADLATDQVKVNTIPDDNGKPPRITLDPNNDSSKYYHHELDRLRYALHNVLDHIGSKDVGPKYQYWTTQGNGKNGHLDGHGKRPDE